MCCSMYVALLVTLLIVVLCLARQSMASSAQPSILTPPVDATVCLNSTAKFYCSTDGQALEWRLNGTGADAFSELQIIINYLSPGIEATLLVPGIRKFENTDITCTGGTLGVGSSTSDPVQLFVQGPPSLPSDLNPTLLNETSIKLTWSVPPGVLDEELISYLVEVRNESGGLIVLSETDGTEYTFSMDNPDPCGLYSSTVTPLCGTLEGETSAEVTETFFDVAEQVTVMDFTLELMDNNEEAMVTLNVPYSNGVCSYSVNATSIDGGEPLFTDKKFLAGEDVTINYISLPLPTSEEYYITVSACNALGCGPPSSPLTIMNFNSTSSLFSVLMLSGKNTVQITCMFTQDSPLSACFFIFTEDDDSLYFYLGAERHNSTAVGSVELPHGNYSWSVFGVEITGLPEHNAAITGTLVVEGNETMHVNPQDMSDTVSIDSLPEDRVCVTCGSDSEKVVLVHAPHHVNNLRSNFLNEEGEKRSDDKACFNGVSFGDLVAVFEGSVLSGEIPYVEVVMEDVYPSFTWSPVPSSTATPEVPLHSSSVIIVPMIAVIATVLIVLVLSAVLLVLMFRVRKDKQGTHNIVGYELSYDQPGTGVQVKPSLARPNPYETAPYKPDLTVEDYTEEVIALLRVDLPNSAVSYNRESVSIGEPLPGVTRNEPQENQESQPHESDQSQDRVEERQHGRNQLQESEDHSQNSVEESGEAAHVAFTIPDGDDEPESFQGQCVHGSSSPMVFLPNDAQHVYPSENLQSLIEPDSEQPHQESDDEEAAAEKREDHPTNGGNERPTTVPMTRLTRALPASTTSRCDTISDPQQVVESLSNSELHAPDTENENWDSLVVGSLDALVRSGTPMSGEAKAREIDVAEEPKWFIGTDESSETSGLLNTDGLRKTN